MSRCRLEICSRLLLYTMAIALLAGSTVRAGESSLPIVGTLGTGPAMNVAVVGDRAFVIGKGKLHTLDIRDPARPKVLGTLDGLGNTRQIVVADGVAYVSARESGLFIVDVKEDQPRLLAHYDSIELATGVAIAGKVLFVAQRHFGVELVDVADSKRPRHLSTIRTGEAQSIAYHDGMLYTGVWGTSEIVTADVRDPLHPRIVSKVPMDGYGDGVAAHDGKLFAATGHHSRAPHAKPEDPGYGSGHGLEIFSLADPAKPAFLGRVKFPRFYEIGFDMWDVQVTGTTAFVGDTHNGLFVVNVRDPSKPSIIARTQLPKPSPNAKHADHVGGFGLVKDHVYVAGGATELHILAAKGMANPVIDDSGKRPVVASHDAPKDDHVYRSDGQVHAVAVRGDLTVVACGSAGVHTLRVGDKLALLHAQPSKGVVTDVCMVKDIVFVAEGMAGMSMPFFVYFPTQVPHGRSPKDGDEIQVPDIGPYADREWTPLEKLYAAAIPRLDSHVGRIIQELKDQGIDEKTVITEMRTATTNIRNGSGRVAP